MLSSCIQSVEAPTLPLSSTPTFPPEVIFPSYEGNGELEGHSWQVGEVTFSFQASGHMLVKGGPLDETMPTGAPARYTLKKSSLKLKVLGRDYKGQWKDHHLTVNGNPGVYLGLTDTVFPDPTQATPEPTEETPNEYQLF
jgi:hypothetical protein